MKAAHWWVLARQLGARKHAHCASDALRLELALAPLPLRPLLERKAWAFVLLWLAALGLVWHLRPLSSRAALRSSMHGVGKRALVPAELLQALLVPEEKV